MSSESDSRSTPRLWRVAKVKDITELNPVFVEINGTKVGVYLFKGRYFAYRNTCPHQGGPAVEGEVLGNTEVEIMPDGRRRSFSSGERFNVVCPWHGVEYDLESGVCRAGKRMRLSPYKVVIEGDEVKVGL